MAYVQKDNQASLFKNLKKPEGSNHPDFTGQAMVDGVMKDASLWVKTDKNGNKWFSISFKPPWTKKVAGDDDAKPIGTPYHKPAASMNDIDSDIPF